MTESWMAGHARENPGHTVIESISLPPRCETCGAKSPAWGMEKAEVPGEWKIVQRDEERD